MKIRPGRLLSVAIVVAWGVLVGLHMSRSYARRDAVELIDRTASSSTAGAGLTQRGVFYRGARIGFLRERLTPLEEGGYRAEQTGELTLPVLGRARRMMMEGMAETAASGELRRFELRLSTSTGRSPFETRVSGTVEDDVLALSISSHRSDRTERRALREPIVIPLNLYYSLAARGWNPGESYRVRLFDPMTLSDGEATIEVKHPEIVRWGGKEEEAYRLQTTFAGLTTTAWVTESGEVLQEETPLGWTLRKELPGSGLSARAPDAPPDVMLQSAVPAIGFADDASMLAWAKLKLNDFPESFDAIEGGRQRLVEDGLMITRERPPHIRAASLSTEERAEALAADAFVQSDDARIIAQSRKITAKLSPFEKAKALNEWVYDNIAKSPTLSLPSATEVLEQRIGDCNEHTVLYTALARAAGIPTRISTGLAYTAGQFYYHAWAEVWLGNWVAVDPTFGQFPADPLHVRLLTGGLEGQYEILGLLGKGASIEVVETR